MSAISEGRNPGNTTEDEKISAKNHAPHAPHAPHGRSAADRRGHRPPHRRIHALGRNIESSAGHYVTNPCFPRRKPGFFCTGPHQASVFLMMSAFLSTTRLRPLCLASYIASSAIRTRASAVRFKSRLRAMPIEAVTVSRDLPP